MQNDWGRAHPDLATAFVKSYVQAVRWFYDPANKGRAIQILVLETNSNVDDADIAQVLDALVKLDQVKAPVPPPTKSFDNRFATLANDQLRGR